jgi:hypothetical protein
MGHAVSNRLVVSVASEIPSFNVVKPATQIDAVAGGKFPPVISAVACRRSFPALWAEYLRENFRTAYAVERAFGIDSHTARDWIGGKRDPSGSFVAAVVAHDPKAIEILGRIG